MKIPLQRVGSKHHNYYCLCNDSWNMLINIEFYNPQANKYLIATMDIYLKTLGSITCIMIWEIIHIMKWRYDIYTMKIGCLAKGASREKENATGNRKKIGAKM